MLEISLFFQKKGNIPNLVIEKLHRTLASKKPPRISEKRFFHLSSVGFEPTLET